MTMDQLIAGFTSKLREAITIAKKAEIKPHNFPLSNIVVTGLGGSGIGGNLVYEFVNDELRIPFEVNKDYFLPIVHVESDYKLPLFVGDLLEIQIVVEDIGQTSFTFGYTILNHKKECVGTAKTVHVTISKKTHKKIPLPKEMRVKIEELYAQDHPSVKQ